MHFIDEDWNLVHFVLAFDLMPYPHNGVNIAKLLLNVFDHWQITDHIFSIVLDNASNNTMAITEMTNELTRRSIKIFDKRIIHSRCIAHIINLIARNGISIINSEVEKLRDIVKKIHTSPKKYAEFIDICQTMPNACELKNKAKPYLDVSTRWNSTYDMLVTTVPYQQVFQEWYKRDGQLNDIDDREWENIELIQRLLQPLQEITKTLSQSDSPTIHLVYSAIQDLKKTKLNLLAMKW